MNVGKPEEYRAADAAWVAATELCSSDPKMHDLLVAAYMLGDGSELLVRFRASAEWREVRRLLPDPPARIVEIGSGRCVLSSALAVEGYTVAALEPCMGGPVGARVGHDLLSNHNVAGTTVLVALGEAIPLSSSSADVVIARQMMHHADLMAPVCAEVERVLVPGGLFLALREHVVSSDSQLRRFWRDHPLHALTGDEMAYPVSCYLEAIEGAGLRVVSVLRPLASQINLWPSEEPSVGMALLSRIGVPTGVRSRLAPAMTSILTRIGPLLDLVDRRPGRLYSFTAVKPR